MHAFYVLSNAQGTVARRSSPNEEECRSRARDKRRACCVQQQRAQAPARRGGAAAETHGSYRLPSAIFLSRSDAIVSPAQVPVPRCQRLLRDIHVI